MLPAPANGAQGNRTQMLIRYARGEGVILDGDFTPFHDVTVLPASGAEVRAWLERSARPDAKLALGELASLTDVPCLADAGGFNRHTFLCGQSGSGKTYSLGVILERLLTETDLRLVILDPNSDFVRLGTIRDGTDAALAGPCRQAARGVTLLSADAPRNEGCASTRPRSIRRRRRPCLGWTRSRTARNTPRWPECSRAR